MTTYKRILVEGCDGSGKSSLVRFLEDKLNGNTLTTHWTAPPKHMPLAEKNNYMNQVHKHGIALAHMLQNHIIFDRFHTSDLVYLPIYSRGVNDYTWKVDSIMADIGFKQVYVFTSANEIKARLAKRGDWFIDTDDVERILERYEHVIKLQTVPTFMYYTGPMSERRAHGQNIQLLQFLEIGGKADETVHKDPSQ